jgi:hypothetical protein
MEYTLLFFPVLIGFVSAILAAFVSWVVEDASRRRSNRELQVNTAIEICQKITKAMDSLYALMKNEAWHVAWRKAQNESLYSEELALVDEQKWATYNKLLDDWRSNTIAYETELQGTFGEQGYEAFLFLQISSTIELCAGHLWNIYYAPDGEGEMDSVLPVWRKGKAVLENLCLDKSLSGQLESMETYFALLDQEKDQIAIMSTVMINCIQKHNVGNLRTHHVPVPESIKMEEAAKKEEAGLNESATSISHSQKEAMALLPNGSAAADNKV